MRFLPRFSADGAAIRWAGFTAMCVGMFMAILDIQVVATSLPTIQDALHISAAQMSWIQTTYLAAEVIAIPLTGFFTRLLGIRWLFATAVGVFTLASTGCAASESFSALVAWRLIQGFSGGMLIPTVFSSVFLLFPPHRQGPPTTLAGVLAVLAPTVGPIVGGWITETWSWHWLFLINVVPGLICMLVAVRLLPVERPAWSEARLLDTVSLVLLASSLATLQIGLKEAPERGWLTLPVCSLLAFSLAAGCGFVIRTLRQMHPVVELRMLADRRFLVGCILSFILGVGLFGSTYLMPLFLAFTHGYTALQIGEVMLVTGVAQLLVAPIAVALERRVDSHILTAFGFALFALGLGLSSLQTRETEFDEMFWPQVIRGAAIMFCLLPPTRLALGHLPIERVPDGSGLFNLMRNLGGAIGLAIIDTVIYGRIPDHVEAIVARLRAGDTEMARAVGIPIDMFLAQRGEALSAATQATLQSMVERLALVEAINEAWAFAAILTIAALIILPFARIQSMPPAGRNPLH